MLRIWVHNYESGLKGSGKKRTGKAIWGKGGLLGVRSTCIFSCICFVHARSSSKYRSHRSGPESGLESWLSYSSASSIFHLHDYLLEPSSILRSREQGQFLFTYVLISVKDNNVNDTHKSSATQNSMVTSDSLIGFCLVLYSDTFILSQVLLLLSNK